MRASNEHILISIFGGSPRTLPTATDEAEGPPSTKFYELRDNLAGSVYSIEKVRDELIGGGDELADWARAQPDTFFVPADAAALPSLQETTTWATGAGYEAAAVSTFLQGADYYCEGAFGWGWAGGLDVLRTV